jgi:acyl-CoA thioesterase I
VNQPVRICVIGDELVAGAGDPRGLGWVGRVAARTQPEQPPHVYTLAVPGESTTALAARWEQEVTPRLPDEHRHLVVGLGRADLRAGVSMARSRLNLANVLDVAEQRQVRTFVVGPPPGAREDAERVAELSAALGDVARRRQVPYVETWAPLAQHEQWSADLAAGDGHLPGQAGYGLMAWLVLHGGWHRWLGLPDETA